MSPSGKELPEFIRGWTAPFHVTMDGIKDANGCWICSATNHKLATQIVELMNYAALSVPTPGIGGAEDERHLTLEEQRTLHDAWRAASPVRQVLPVSTPQAGDLGAVKVGEYCDVLDSCLETFWCLTKDGTDDRILADGALDAVKGIRAAILSALSSSPVGEMDAANRVDKTDVRDREDLRRASPQGVR